MKGAGLEGSKKKQAGEHLKNADRLLKASEFESALVEVERCLELDPGNFYAHAYKERIVSLRAKAQEQAAAAPPVAPKQASPAPAAHAAPAAPAAPAAKPAEGSSPGTQEEARKRFLEEKRRHEEELRKQAEEARRRAEEELRRRAQELESMHTSEILERKKLQEEERLRKENDQSRRAAEDQARKKLEEELQARNAGAQRAAEEAEAIRAAEADGKARAKEQKLHDYLIEAKEKLSKRDLTGAEASLLRIVALHAGHSEAEQMLAGLRQMLEKTWEQKIQEAESLPRETALALYRKALTVAYREGAPDQAVAGILAELRKNLSVTDAEHAAVDPEAKLAAYAAALAQRAGAGDDDPFLTQLRKELGVSDAQHQKLRKP